MTAETQSQNLDEGWISFTDGTQTATLQVSIDAVRVVSSVAKPDPEADGFILDVGMWNITPPTVAWVRAHNTYARIVYTLL